RWELMKNTVSRNQHRRDTAKRSNGLTTRATKLLKPQGHRRLLQVFSRQHNNNSRINSRTNSQVKRISQGQRTQINSRFQRILNFSRRILLPQLRSTMRTCGDLQEPAESTPNLYHLFLSAEKPPPLSIEPKFIQPWNSIILHRH